MSCWRALLTACSLIWMTACTPQPESQSDGQKDPFFQLGRRLVTERDYKGAVDAFEKALELNPRSVMAHYELGLLYESRILEPAIALYHYKQVLRLQPNGHPAEIVMARIKGCEQEIAKSVALVQADPAVMAELQRLKQENAQLQRDLNTMRALAANSIAVFTNPPPSTPVQGAQSPPAVSSSPSPAPPRPPAIQLDTPDRTRLADNARTITRNTPSPAPPQRPAQPAGYATNYSTGSSTPRRPPPANPTRPARTHVVKEGETFSSLSRQYGITVAALRSANPYASPEKLRPGQALTIPTR